MTKGELAKEYFKSGVNCAQAVALAFKDQTDMSEEQIKKLVIGFGGGLARQRSVCGAVSGMVMILSYLRSDGVDKQSIYKLIQDACAEVKDKLGSMICAELLDGKVKVDSNPKPEDRTEEYYKKRPCAEIVQVVADITEKYLNL